MSRSGDVSRDDALLTLVTGWMSHIGPATASQLGAALGLPASDIEKALLRMEASGDCSAREVHRLRPSTRDSVVARSPHGTAVPTQEARDGVVRAAVAGADSPADRRNAAEAD